MPPLAARGTAIGRARLAGTMAKARPPMAKGKGGKGSDRRRLVGGLVAVLVVGLGAKYFMTSDSRAGASTAATSTAASTRTAAPPSLYESGLSATKMDGESVPIASFKGKALLMLNVASL